MTIQEQIATFLTATAFGVIGASADRSKFGNKVVRCYQMHNKRVFPVNPKETSIEGISCVAGVADLPPEVTSISIITPPTVSEQVVEAAIVKGIKNIWMQPGAESPLAIKRCREAGVNLIADGSCILVVLGYHDH